MPVLVNRAKMSTSTTGTGTITLGSAEDGYQTFADAGVANSNVVRYVIEDGNNWEIGTGTYTASGTTLSRTVSESSNSDAAINLSGSATVFIGATAEDVKNFVASTGTATAPNDSVSIAIGGQAVASGTNSISLQRANSSGVDSIAAITGNTTTSYGAQGGNSISIGALSKATALAGTAVGYGATSTHVAASAFGTSATTTASNQIALGGSGITARISGAYNLPTSDGTNGQVLTTNGSGAVTFADAGGSDPDLYRDNASSATTPSATGANAVAIGDTSVASGADCISLGSDTEAKASFSVALGQGATAETNCIGGVAIGYNTTAWSNRSISIGNAYGGTGSLSNYSTAIGYRSKAGVDQSTGQYATALGIEAIAIGQQSVALTDSYASGTDSFAAAIGNNSTSYGATNTSSISMGKINKAAGYESFVAGGYGNTVNNYRGFVTSGWNNTVNSNYGGILGGEGNTINSSSNYGVILNGEYNEINRAYTVASGKRAKTRVEGQVAHSSGHFSGTGDAQASMFVLRSDTDNATPQALSTTNSAASFYNQVSLDNYSALSFHGTIVARQQAADGTACAAWKVEGLIRKEGNAGTTVLVNSATTVLDNTPNWGMALSADTTIGCLKVQVTGAASTDIRWVATIHTSEVTYA